jgi:tRNA (guanine-N7-)-methyltransferase
MHAHAARPPRVLPGVDGLPLDPEVAFGRSGPLVVEIGFGNGAFLRALARENPQWNLLGVEIATASITRGVRMIWREQLRHTRVYCGDGRMLLREMLPQASVHRVYVNFPDPWPKERHQSRRLMQVPFLRMLSTRLQPGGELWFTTDHAEYFAFAVAEAQQTGLYEVRIGDAPETALTTKYALRWQQMRKRIHHAVFAPLRADSDPHPPRLEVFDMAHARLQGDLGKITRFEKQSFAIPLGHLVLLDAARTLDGRRLLVRVLVEEADLRQDLLIEVRPAASGAVYVELEPFGSPAATRGARLAVERVADWLQSQGFERIGDQPES